jgi:hypothetical protein
MQDNAYTPAGTFPLMTAKAEDSDVPEEKRASGN